MQAAVEDIEVVGNLLDRARHEAGVLRSFAACVKDESVRNTRLRQAALIDELVRYAEDRDRALVERVRELAILRARLEAT